MIKECKFYKCPICGNIVELIVDKGVPLNCCGKKMELLTPNTVEASTEKHVPVVCIDGNKIFIKIGSAEHPMTEEHYIEWISFVSEGLVRRVQLKPGDKPEAHFGLGHKKPLKVYAYCNLHGLWATDVAE